MAGRSSDQGVSRDHDHPLSPITPVSPLDTQNVFSDDYAEFFNESYAPSLAAPSIRHTRSASPSPKRSSFQRTPSRTSVHGLTSPFADPPTRSRSSIRKSRSSGDDGIRTETRRREGPALVTGYSSASHSGSSGLAHRSISSASSFAGSQSPFADGGEGPSHPYAMYPQGLAMSRTASIASTTRPLSHAPSLRGPAHPYGLYTQNVDDDLSSGNQQDSIPVGFPGANSRFHRRRGPDGEEQDIIGPDGHTEQLPPYSRYPEQADHKTVAQAGPLPSIGEQRTEETSPLSPVPAAHLSTAPVQSQALSAEPDVSEQNFNEKKWDDKSRKEKWKTKAFGVPLWVFLLAFVLVLVLAVVVGAAAGAIISKARQHSGKGKSEPPLDAQSPPTTLLSSTNSPTTTSTAFLDVASPTSTPTWMSPVEAGNYSIEAGSPTANFSGCLQPQQRPAWSCLLHDETSVLVIDQTDNGTVMSLIDTNPLLQYGTQPPVVTSDKVQLVQDPETSDKAYAYHFQSTYDKLVVLEVNNSLLPLDSDPNTKRKRDSWQPWYTTGFQQKSQMDAQDMDNVDENHAWFCYWNQTFIEVLVYMPNTTNSTNSTTSASSSEPPSPSAPTSTSSSTSVPPSLSSPSKATSPSAAPTLSTSSTSSTFSPYIGHGPQVFSSMTSFMHPPRDVSYPASSLSSPSSTITASASASSSSSSSSTSSLPPSKKIKIEERRIPALDAPPPTCTLMQNDADGQWRPLIQANGLIPVVALKEQDPSATPTGFMKRSGIPVDACGCQWDSPESVQM